MKPTEKRRGNGKDNAMKTQERITAGPPVRRMTNTLVQRCSRRLDGNPIVAVRRYFKVVAGRWNKSCGPGQKIVGGVCDCSRIIDGRRKGAFSIPCEGRTGNGGTIAFDICLG